MYDKKISIAAKGDNLWPQHPPNLLDFKI